MCISFRPSRLLLALAFAGFTCLLNPFAFAAGSGGGSNDSYTPGRGLSPERISNKAFKSGIKQRDKALAYEAKAAAATSDKARAKALAKAQKAFTRAAAKQGEAVKVFPQNYKAANELGFALRKTGDFSKAIGAYNFALDINPNFHQAREYRAEAYLALGMLDRTKVAYMKLFRDDRDLADQLMGVIDQWVEDKGSELAADESQFVSWVNQRKRMAKITADLSMNNQRSW